ncbi:hypothetical protein ACW9ID_21435 [Pseudomonas gingeri]
MASLDCKIIEALDTIDEVSRVVTCMGVTVAARALDEYESSGVTAVLNWSTQRQLECVEGRCPSGRQRPQLIEQFTLFDRWQLAQAVEQQLIDASSGWP